MYKHYSEPSSGVTENETENETQNKRITRSRNMNEKISSKPAMKPASREDKGIVNFIFINSVGSMHNKNLS